jgi:penicillin amidase
MKLKTGWLGKGLGVLGLAVLGAGAVLSVYGMRTLPQTTGTLTLSGLNAPVQVRRDAADVTHIVAQSPLDAYRALGMVHAQERAWQLEFNRRVMQGTLSEVLGPATLGTDTLLRTLGIHQAAQRQWEELPPEAKDALQAYADGINAFMAQNRQPLTPEFKLLGIRPQADAAAGNFWTPVDSVGWSLMMALDLGGNWGNEVARLSAAQVLDTPDLWKLFPPYPSDPPAAKADLSALYRSLGVYESKKSEANKSDTSSAEGDISSKFRQTLAQDINTWAGQLGSIQGKGSNNWVVAGSHTTSGKPLLANDPHLGLSAPAIWYFASLQTPAMPPAKEGKPTEGLGALNVIGATLPGLPFVVLGHTDTLAWGFTNTGPDVQDLYLEQVNPTNPAQYRVPAAAGQPLAWADFAVRDEVIRVKGQPDVALQVRSTRHGPVISDAQLTSMPWLDASRYVLALRWTALDPDNQTVAAGMESNHARTVPELMHAYRLNHSPMQNAVMADAMGNVAYKAVGRVPVRSPANDIQGVAPSPGWDARYDWQGWIPYADTPETWVAHASNSVPPDAGLVPLKTWAEVSGAAVASRAAPVAPAPLQAQMSARARQANASASAIATQRGYLATANQRIHAADYPYFITSDWTVPYRKERISTLLEQTPLHSVQSMEAIQADQLSLATQRLLPLLQKTASNHPLAADAQHELQGFDGVMRADAAAPLIFTAWADELTHLLVAPKLGTERFAAMYAKRQFRDGLEVILERNDAAWCGTEGCQAASAQALDAALTRLQKQYGSHVAGWMWGAAHPAVSVHRPFSSVKALAPLFEVRVPTGGDAFTVNVGRFNLDDPRLPYANRHAASMRAVYDLADLNNSRFIYQTGQSGNVFSSRYSDMSHEWAGVHDRPLQLQPGAWASVLTLTP